MFIYLYRNLKSLLSQFLSSKSQPQFYNVNILSLDCKSEISKKNQLIKKPEVDKVNVLKYNLLCFIHIKF